MIPQSFFRLSLRILAGTLALCTLTLLIVWGLSTKQSRAIDFGRVSISMSANNLEFTLSTAPVQRTPGGWLFPNPGARILVESGSAWRPTTSTASISFGPATTPLAITLHVLFIPVWIALLFLVLTSTGSFLWSRRIISPGHCTACGYDLRGNSGPRCPECGGTFSISALLSRLIPASACGALFLCGCSTSQQPPPPSDARQLFSQAIEVLQLRPLGREGVNWPSVYAELQPTIHAGAPPAAAHEAITAAVARLHDPHARFVPPPSPAPSQSQPPQTTSTTAPQHTVPTIPEGHMLEGNIAFVTVPLCMAPDVDGLRAYARTLRSAVLNLESLHPKAWIIDLRFNGGGNIWPMLLGLRPVLGDGVLTTSTVGHTKVSLVVCDGSVVSLDQGGGLREQLRIEPPENDALVAHAPVAVLIGPWTMSSGELLALAFHHYATFFGEPTAGLTTVTDYFPLSDGSILNLPVSHMADREGWAPKGPLTPSHLIQSSDWPSDSDIQVKAAQTWALNASHTP